MVYIMTERRERRRREEGKINSPSNFGETTTLREMRELNEEIRLRMLVFFSFIILRD